MKANGRIGKMRTYFLLAVAVALSFSMLFSSSGGIAGSGESTSWNAAARSCTITAGNNQCTDAFTWPTPLSAAPCAGCSLAAVATSTGSTSDLTISANTRSIFFSLTSVGQTWISMPAAQTEIFADTNHELVEDWTAVTSLDFVVQCPTASTSATATLTIQYSIDQGATWNSIAGSVVNIDATLCGLGIPIDSCISTGGGFFGCYTSIPAPAQVAGVFLRIVGQNGGGIGDNPVFSEAYLLLTKTYTIKFFASATLLGSTATVITVTAKINVIQTGTTTVNWHVEAWICKSGGSGPC